MVRYHDHAFWIYGVIVALAIREALSTVIPHTIPILAQSQITSQPEPKNQLILEAMRLVLFLAMTIRFYLGSCRYFDQVYCADDSAVKFPHANYSMDFVLGLIHFLLFFTWSETLVKSRPSQPWVERILAHNGDDSWLRCALAAA
jgi:hypothetical protein